MRRSLVKSPPLRLPKELAQFFADPPLALNERREDYDDLFAAIAAAAKPADAISWMFVRDITDLSWEIRRERSRKMQLIKSSEESRVADILTEGLDWSASTPGDADASEAARQWASDPKARRKIDKELPDLGWAPTDILSDALDNSDIDEIDKRIASYELRRMAALRAIELYSEKLARRLEGASSKVIDGEFTEAAK
ncbi:MAG: hypothetical protein E7813_11520 [Bradyrhizobium sp.]|uniref:hypothetical protein n=1 Tax=Bradyrhizobium sp. TaxID=376 RepID=UPI0011F6D156|nr:hypothetical protein [Bradyrhizobium sp.]THD68257.1 MAG: hypothetical protein E7813_11520 [Bradyrhizobium sp.]